MRGRDNSEMILGILGMLFYAVVAIVVITIWFPGIAAYLDDAIDWCRGFLGGLIPTGSGIAHAVAWVLGTLMALVLLAGAYFTTGMAGRRQAAGAHGFCGIGVGFTVLTFVTALLYTAGLTFWAALLGGIAISLLIKILFAYWRTRLTGTAAPLRTMQVTYRQRVIRRP